MIPEKLVQSCDAELDHIAIAVKDIDAAFRLYSLLGFKMHHRETVIDQGVDVAVLYAGDNRLELLQPLHEDTPIGRFISRRSEGLHHIALRVDDISKAIENCRLNGFEMLDEVPRIGAEGRLIAFINPCSTNGVLIELTQLK